MEFSNQLGIRLLGQRASGGINRGRLRRNISERRLPPPLRPATSPPLSSTGPTMRGSSSFSYDPVVPSFPRILRDDLLFFAVLGTVLGISLGMRLSLKSPRSFDSFQTGDASQTPNDTEKQGYSLQHFSQKCKQNNYSESETRNLINTNFKYV